MEFELDFALVRLVNMQHDLTRATTGTSYEARLVISEILQVARDRNRSREAVS